MNLALILAVIMYVTGAWPLVTSHARHEVTSRVVPATAPKVTAFPSQPVKTGDDPLQVGADASALAVDRATGTVLYAQNADQKRPIASVTKLMTAIVVLDRHTTGETVTVGALPAYVPDAELLGLRKGDRYHLDDLVKAALVPSANDAADALAIYDAGSIEAFAARMDAKLAEWEIGGASFSNPSGLTDEGNAASAAALGKIATLALRNPTIADIAARSSVTIAPLGGSPRTYPSTNSLLAGGEFYGIKTGYTLAAGQCFVGITKIRGHEVVTVILGSNDRFGDTQTLTNWIGRNYEWL